MDAYNYKYGPLKEKEIRFLKLLPTPELRFEVIHHNLDKSLDYATLSYRWGDGTPIFNQTIYLNEYTFYVTVNLRDAPQNLKHRQLSKDPNTKFKYLWIDQICINQTDSKEKDVQVKMMTRIYDQSHKTIVWLGNPENLATTALAFQKMDDIVARHVHSNSETAVKITHVSLRDPVQVKKTAEKEQHFLFMSTISAEDTTLFDVEGTPNHAAWLGIYEFFKNPWWTRAWIYQEATIPLKGSTEGARGGKVAFLCGFQTTYWNAISWTIDVAKKIVASQLPHAAFLDQCWAGPEKLEDFKNYRQEALVSPRIKNMYKPKDFKEFPASPLLELLQIFRNTEATDPRDKVIAPLGIASQEIIEKVNCGYDQSVLEIYLRIPKFCLAEEPERELDFLGHAMKLNKPIRTPTKLAECLSWPSWIPNWDQPLPLHPIPKLFYKTVPAKRAQHLYAFSPFPIGPYLGPKDTKVEAKCYNASNGTRVQASISGGHLIIKGARCDTIKDIKQLTGPATSKTFLEQTRPWETVAKGGYVTGEPWMNALRRTQAMDAKYDWEGRVVERNYMYRPGMSVKLVDRKHLSETVSEETRVSMTFIEKNHFPMRNLCVTEKGYLGMVPETAIVGDIICIFLGGQVLYTLRYSGKRDEFEYIGETYLHGLMDGEVMEWVENPGIPTRVETFVLV